MLLDERRHETSGITPAGTDHAVSEGIRRVEQCISYGLRDRKTRHLVRLRKVDTVIGFLGCELSTADKTRLFPGHRLIEALLDTSDIPGCVPLKPISPGVFRK